jgi:hypothetical protein
VVERARAGAKGLLDGVQAVQNIHGFSVIREEGRLRRKGVDRRAAQGGAAGSSTAPLAVRLQEPFDKPRVRMTDSPKGEALPGRTMFIRSIETFPYKASSITT